MYDLHSHSTHSDGELSPGELCDRAARNGVSHLAITDHDTLGVHAMSNELDTTDITLIAGLELSTQWGGRGIHVVGLDVDVSNVSLQLGVASQQEQRTLRAVKIAHRLAALGLGDSLPRVREMAASAAIGRPHFARYLVETGAVGNSAQAFKKYLGNGKPGDIRADWASLQTVTNWIAESGGTAVLAHPGHYRLTRTKLIALIEEFKEAGGKGIEVVRGNQDRATTQRIARIANDMELLASCGSDFHRPHRSWSDLGRFSPLPPDCVPVWTEWQHN